MLLFNEQDNQGLNCFASVVGTQVDQSVQNGGIASASFLLAL